MHIVSFSSELSHHQNSKQPKTHANLFKSSLMYFKIFDTFFAFKNVITWVQLTSNCNNYSNSYNLKCRTVAFYIADLVEPISGLTTLKLMLEHLGYYHNYLNYLLYLIF